MLAHHIGVIGAGPAGSVAAHILAKAGIDVILFDIASSRSVDSCRGETFNPAASPALARLGLTRRITLLHMPQVTGFSSRWGAPSESNRPAFAVPDAPIFRVDRSALNEVFRSAAVEAGATLYSARVHRLMPLESGWRLSCSDGRQVEVRLLIDASGRGARFGRRLGARLFGFDRMIAFTRAYESSRHDNDKRVIIESVQDGWIFSTLDASSTRIVSLFTDNDLGAGGQGDRILDSTIVSSNTLAGMIWKERAFTRHIRPAGFLALDTSTLPAMLVVGDASQTRDPLSSHGIVSAIEDAESAVHCLIESMRHSQNAPLRRHEDWRRHSLAGHLRERTRYYRSENRWPTFPFWHRRSQREGIERSFRLIRAR